MAVRKIQKKINSVLLLAFLIPMFGVQPSHASISLEIPMILYLVDTALSTVKVIAIPEKRVGTIGTNHRAKLKLEFKDASDGTVFQASTFNSGTTGHFLGVDISALTAGTYDIYIKGESHLTRKLDDFSLTSDVEFLDFTESETNLLRAGDINGTEFGDDVVNALDLSILSNDLDTFDLRSDLNRDNIVNSLDLSVLLNNLDTRGDI